MTTSRVHAGNRWLAGITVTLPQAVPLLTVTKSADSATINGGETIGFTITIASTGNGDVTLVHLTDQLFSVLPSAPAWTEITDNASCTIDVSNLLSCSFASIVSGAPAITLHVTAPTTQLDCGQTGNQAFIDFEDFNGRSGSGSSNIASVDIVCPTPAPTDTPTNTPTETPTDTPTNTPTVTNTPPPGATDTPFPTETSIPATEAPTETAAPTETPTSTDTPAATATSETTGGVTDLPNTGGGPESGVGGNELWLLVTLLVVIGVGVGGFHARRSR
jgi:uncharacterized repeat protein (TIGR01451 family)